MAVGCSNGTTDEKPPEGNERTTVYTDKTQNVEITISNRDISARARDVWNGDNYAVKLNGNVISRGTVRYDGANNMYLRFTPADGTAGFLGNLTGGVLTIESLVYSGGTLKNLKLDEAGGSGAGGPVNKPTGPVQSTEPVVLSKTITYTVTQAGGTASSVPSTALEFMFDRPVTLTNSNVTIINGGGEAYINNNNIQPKDSANGKYWIVTLDDTRSKQGIVNVKVNLTDVFSNLMPVAIYSKVDGATSTYPYSLSSGGFGLSSGMDSFISGQYFQSDTNYLVFQVPSAVVAAGGTLSNSDLQYIKVTPITSPLDDDLMANVRLIGGLNSGSISSDTSYNLGFEVFSGGQGPVVIEFSKPGWVPYVIVDNATKNEPLNYTVSADGSANSETTNNLTLSFEYNPDLLEVNGGTSLISSLQSNGGTGALVYSAWSGGGGTAGVGKLQLTNSNANLKIQNPNKSIKERVLKLPDTSYNEQLDRLNTREGMVSISLTNFNGVTTGSKPVTVHRSALAKIIGNIVEVKTGGVSTGFLFTLDRAPVAGFPLTSAHCVVDAGPGGALPGTVNLSGKDIARVGPVTNPTNQYVFSFTGSTAPTATVVTNPGLARFSITGHPDIDDFRIVSLTNDKVGFAPVSATGGTTTAGVATAVTVRFEGPMRWYSTGNQTGANVTEAVPTALTRPTNNADFLVTYSNADLGFTDISSAGLGTVGTAPTFANTTVSNFTDTVVTVTVTGWTANGTNLVGLYPSSSGYQIASFVDSSITSSNSVRVTIGN